MVVIGAGDHDPNKSGGGLISKSGKYHVQLINVEEKEDMYTIKYKVLGGEHSDQVGRSLSNWLNFPQPSDDGNTRTARGNAICRQAIACGLLTNDQWKAAKEGGEPLEIDLGDAMDTDCIIEVSMKLKDTAEKGSDDPDDYWRNITGSWHVNDPTVKDVPRGSMDDGEPVAAGQGASNGSGKFEWD